MISTGTIFRIFVYVFIVLQTLDEVSAIRGKNAKYAFQEDEDLLKALPSLREFWKENGSFSLSLDENHHERSLSEDDRPCNSKFTSFTVDDFKLLTNFYLNFLLRETPQFIPVALGLISSVLKYDVDVYKICGSCDSLRDSISSSDFNDYCGEDIYGSDAMHSSLMFVPVNTTTGVAPTGSLAGIVNMHGTIITLEEAPTIRFPDNLVLSLSQVNTTNGLEIVTFAYRMLPHWVAMMGSSAGALGIVPDYIGYGESRLTHNRTYLIDDPYKQAAVVSWLVAQEQLKTMTQGCTQLRDTTTVLGTSEGGYGAISASTAFRNLGINILTNFPSVPALDAETVMREGIAYYENGNIDKGSDYYQRFASFGAFALYAYSTYPPMVNFLEGKLPLNKKFNIPGEPEKDVLSWFQNPEPVPYREVLELVPNKWIELVNPDLVALYGSNSTDPCSNPVLNVPGKTDKFCEAFKLNSNWPEISAADYPIVICSSPNDSIATPGQLPESLFENENVTRLPNLLGLPLPEQDHILMSIVCNLGPLTFLADTTNPTAIAARTIEELSKEGLGICQKEVIPNTQSPTGNSGEKMSKKGKKGKFNLDKGKKGKKTLVGKAAGNFLD